MHRALLRMLVVGLVGLVGCGGARPAPAPPPPSPAAEMRALAAELDAQMAEVARILREQREDCPRMASTLRVVFARMEVSIARARAAQQDPERAKLLTAELRAYDEASARRTAEIDRDFTVDSPCARDRDVQQALMSMPTL